MSIKGLFHPAHPEKYRGDLKSIVFRSSWELIVMRKFDSHPGILEWSSEPFPIPYEDASSRRRGNLGRLRRYYVDFWVKIKTKDGLVETLLIEVKPAKETRPPVKGKKRSRRYLTESLTYAKNMSKWEAARRYCAMQGWKFVIWTEREIGIPEGG